jgi:hypothetical protein
VPLSLERLTQSCRAERNGQLVSGEQRDAQPISVKRGTDGNLKGEKGRRRFFAQDDQVQFWAIASELLPIG